MSGKADTAPVTFTREIQFSSVTFSYPGSPAPAVNNVSLTIGHHQTIGLIGASGSGKTTLVDLLLGLYLPDAGEIRIDGQPLTPANLRCWQAKIGYVPQHIFLCDDTIANNIAFGVPASEISREQITHAARLAHLHDFIETLTDGYDTVVGERGVRLSGGQRQRIGIARALYHDPELLVMDEATSALDGATETAVMEAINELSGKKTIVLIAHRMTTVEGCDSITMLESGEVVAQGDYSQLMTDSQKFRATTLSQS